MRGLWVAVLLLGLVGPGLHHAEPQEGPAAWPGLEGLEAASLEGAGVSALHREYDKGWRQRVGSAAAEPAADDEDAAEGDAGGHGPGKPVDQDSAFEDALPPKRRRYNRKRPRPGQGAPQEDADGEAPAKRRKPLREDDEDALGDEYRRRKPGQRRRRPQRPDADPAADAEVGDEEQQPPNPNAEQGGAAAPVDLKALLKQTAGHLSLSELLQNRNLSLSDLLKGNRGALSALTAQQTAGEQPVAPTAAAGATTTSTSTTAASDTTDRDPVPPSTERHNGFVPSKPRRLPPVPRPTVGLSTSTSTRPVSTEEPEITTSRPRRLPAVVARAKEQQHQKEQQQQQQHQQQHVLQGKGHADALDPMSPAMMAMITLEAADTHTSKPRRIPPPAATTTAPSPSPSPETSPPNSRAPQEAEDAATSPMTTLPPREFYPLNVDSLEITTPRLMGVSKASHNGKAQWLPPADRIIDAQVFSPGSIANKFRSHGFAASAEQAEPAITTTTTTSTSSTTTTTPTAAPATAPSHNTLQNTSDHFRLENETLDLKEGSNALDKRKIATAPGGNGVNVTSAPQQQANAVNELDREQEKAEKRKTFATTPAGPRRLPPTLAGTRRLPAPNPALVRPKSTTEAPAPVRETPAERVRIPFLGTKRLKDKEREKERERERELERERERDRDSLLPPTRFALPLPEVISVEKMIADARSRGAFGSSAPSSSERPSSEDSEDTTTTTSTTAVTTTTFGSRDEIVDLLKSEQSSTRLARILAERNMTLEDLLQHRERGSSQLHFADFFRNASASSAADDKPAVDLVPKEIAPAERKESVNILRTFHEVPKYPFAYAGTDDSEEAASTLSLVNVKPAGIVLPADPGERYHQRDVGPSRAPRVIPPQQPPPPPPPPPPQPFPIPTFRLPEPPAHGGNPYLVIKHVADRPDAVVLEHVGEIHQVGVSSSVEEAIVVDSGEQVRDRDRPDRLDRMSLPSGVKSAIIASTVICGLAIVGFLAIFIVFRWRQKRALVRARGAILCEQLQRGSFRGRSLSPVLVNVKNSQVQPMQGHPGGGGPLPYYSKKDLSSRATSNTASNRHYYLWRSLRKTFQEDDME